MSRSRSTQVLTILQVDNPTILKFFKEATPAGRMGTVDDITPMICYLLSDAASFSTGADHVVTGKASRTDLKYSRFLTGVQEVFMLVEPTICVTALLFPSSWHSRSPDKKVANSVERRPSRIWPLPSRSGSSNCSARDEKLLSLRRASVLCQSKEM